MRVLRAALALVASTLPYPATAHGLVPGPPGIYAALLHTITEMPGPLALFALGLLFGLNGRQASSWAWAPFLVGIAAGLTSMLVLRIYIDPELPLLLFALIASVWAASGIVLPAAVAAIMSVGSGFLLGIFIAPGPAVWSIQAFAIVGGLIAIFFSIATVITLVMLISKQQSSAWTTIAVRILASWLAATIALVAALATR